jgi:predicted metal-binding transcription factor (methanogenesis marker protein 9)
MQCDGNRHQFSGLDFVTMNANVVRIIEMCVAAACAKGGGTCGWGSLWLCRHLGAHNLRDHGDTRKEQSHQKYLFHKRTVSIEVKKMILSIRIVGY